ncbi:hypothetical protein PGT21_005434 [Puccinia graminis f. sp. tritici]|uniref:Uncharacterized protein n=1 Tax=Puccinia graminis f. sp. tritici TaxID=56615 RepID=A0A5B0MJJ1_PUCGR|nr:hypothetical protein PGT21_005434 [Puccinia graminis f. sp. tritici]
MTLMSTVKLGTTEEAGPLQPTPNTTMLTTTSMAGPPEVESTIQPLSEHQNVSRVIILNCDGIVIPSSSPVFQGSDGVRLKSGYENPFAEWRRARLLNQSSLLTLNEFNQSTLLTSNNKTQIIEGLNLQ